MAPKSTSREPLRTTIGRPDCKQPYNASVLNISGMSFGAFSPKAIRALNGGAEKGNFADARVKVRSVATTPTSMVIVFGRLARDTLVAAMRIGRFRLSVLPIRPSSIRSR